MAKSTYEFADIKLSKKNYSILYKSIKNQYKELFDYLYTVADFCYPILKKLGHKKQSSSHFCISHVTKNYPLHSKFSLTQFESDFIFSELYRGKNGQLCKPRKSVFKALGKGLLEEDKTITFAISFYATINFNLENSSVYWDVEQGNHSVSESRDTFFAKLFFKELDSFKWRKGEGGDITYWDEYMSDDNDSDYKQEEDECTSILYP